MEKSKFETEADVAANWWKDNIGSNEKYKSLMAKAKKKDDLSPEKKEAFFQELKGALIEILEQYKRFGLHVDYEPDRVLSEAAERSGIRSTMFLFPWKTSMWIEEGLVTISSQNGAEPQEIYNAKTQSQPQNN